MLFAIYKFYIHSCFPMIFRFEAGYMPEVV